MYDTGHGNAFRGMLFAILPTLILWMLMWVVATSVIPFCWQTVSSINEIVADVAGQVFL